MCGTNVCICPSPACTARSTSKNELKQKSVQTLPSLVKNNPAAETLSKNAKAILAYPSSVQAGLVFGGSYAEGVLMEDGQVANYYHSVSVSWGLQIGGIWIFKIK